MVSTISQLCLQYEQAKHIPGLQKYLLISPRPSNRLLAVLKNILEPKQWKNRTQDKTPRNLEDISLQ